MTPRKPARFNLRETVRRLLVEDQARADERIPLLLDTPAAVRWISAEPLLGPVDLTCVDVDGDSVTNALRPETDREIWESSWRPEATGVTLEDAIQAFTEEGFSYPPSDVRSRGIDWVVAGGESGPGARPMHHEWARSLRDQCQAAGVAFFMKQMAFKAPIPDDLLVREMPK